MITIELSQGRFRVIGDERYCFWLDTMTGTCLSMPTGDFERCVNVMRLKLKEQNDPRT